LCQKQWVVYAKAPFHSPPSPTAVSSPIHSSRSHLPSPTHRL
jgi:hypothetical protein